MDGINTLDYGELYRQAIYVMEMDHLKPRSPQLALFHKRLLL